MTPLPLVSVNLATVAIESVFYGIFVLLSGLYTYFHCNRITFKRGGDLGGIPKYFTPVFCGSMLVSGTITGVKHTTSHSGANTNGVVALGRDCIPPLRSIRSIQEWRGTSALLCRSLGYH